MKNIFALILAVMMMAACAFTIVEKADHESEMDFYDGVSEDYEPILNLYKQAYAEKWDVDKLQEKNLWPLLNTLDQAAAKEIMVDFISLEDSHEASMVVYINSPDGNIFADVLAIYTLKEDGTFVTNVIGDERNQYALGEKDDVMYVLNAGSNNAYQYCCYFLKMKDSKLVMLDGVIVDYEVNTEHPYFYTVDTDWDVTNDTHMSNEEAEALFDSYTPVKMGDPMTLLELGRGTDEECTG